MINAIAIDDEPLALKVITSLCSRSPGIHLTKTFTEPKEAIRHLRKFPADLIICDIHMPSVTGINLIRSLEKDIMVIFTTAFSEYAVESYELKAIDYLLKPVNQKRFDLAVAKAIDYKDYLDKKSTAQARFIYIKADLVLLKIPLSDIIYIEGMADYLQIHIRGRKAVVARMSMKEMTEKLPAADFVRVHRSFILPVKDIHGVRGSTILLGEKEFPVGKTYADEFFERYSKQS